VRLWWLSGPLIASRYKAFRQHPMACMTKAQCSKRSRTADATYRSICKATFYGCFVLLLQQQNHPGSPAFPVEPRAW
jgi:hypothetical protein